MPDVNLTPISPSGISGLDDILRGGFPSDRLFLIEGNPGAGKTTLALQFLFTGMRRGERVLYVTLSESLAEIRGVADSHGWSIEGLPIFEMTPDEKALSSDDQITMFHASELELTETTRALLAEIERIGPQRLVIDSLSELRLLAQNSLRYRRMVLALKQFFSGRHCTVLMLDDRTAGGEDLQLQSIAHGVIRLEQLTTHYGADRRRLSVMKMRGVAFRGGFHDYNIRRGGLDVFPRLVAAEHTTPFRDEEFSSGLADLDLLLGGGLPAGSSTLLMGPAGVGKSTIGFLFALRAAAAGVRTSAFVFDETKYALRRRMTKLGLSLDERLADKSIALHQIDPAEISPGEFVARIRAAVDDGPNSSKIIIIDSLNGYLHSMSESSHLVAQLHELFTFLNQLGVITLVTVTQSGMIGRDMQTPVDTTYLADNVILFRYFEADGAVRRALSVVKKRSGRHESSIREMWMDGSGVHVGAPLANFVGVLTGTPTYVTRDDCPGMESRAAGGDHRLPVKGNP